MMNFIYCENQPADATVNQSLHLLTDPREAIQVDAGSLTITRQQVEGDLVFRLEGELDAVSMTVARGVFAPALYGTGIDSVILDLRKLVYLDSTGLGMLAALYRTTLAGEGDRSVALLILPGSIVERVLYLCGFDTAFTIISSPDEIA
jgi:anti-anti-sigma factor